MFVRCAPIRRAILTKSPVLVMAEQPVTRVGHVFLASSSSSGANPRREDHATGGPDPFRSGGRRDGNTGHFAVFDDDEGDLRSAADYSAQTGDRFAEFVNEVLTAMDLADSSPPDPVSTRTLLPFAVESDAPLELVLVLKQFRLGERFPFRVRLYADKCLRGSTRGEIRDNHGCG